MFVMKRVFPFIASALFAGAALCDDVSLADFKPAGDGKTLDTAALQAAIDACHASGGGEVAFPKKSAAYLTGTLHLKSGVTLNIPANVKILGVADISKYNKGPNASLIYAEGAENVGIRGGGTIDGGGGSFTVKDYAANRPRLVMFADCKNVRVENVLLTQPAFWTLYAYHCDGVVFKGLRIFSHANFNNDGIDIESCNVLVSDCVIDSDDDAICLKNVKAGYVMENVAIINCIVKSNCNFIKFGTASAGDVKNVAISNCVLSRASVSNFRKWEGMVWGVEGVTGIAGIAIESVDGGKVERVNISNIAMSGVQTPVFIRVGARRNPEAKGAIRDVVISGVTARSESFVASSLTASTGRTLENIVLRDCVFELKGGVKADEIKPVDGESAAASRYPENRMFRQPLPAYAFYMRNAANITFDNVQMRLHGAPEYRPAIMAERINRLRILNCLYEFQPSSIDGIYFENCKDAEALNCAKTFPKP